ncbi:MAG: hypothetical protein FJZ01_15965, partial [Candidatus Sericytochromatia bacterium]|nr:hypothetical protein [Candidatus Tanganyikabacteria bacterium]
MDCGLLLSGVVVTAGAAVSMGASVGSGVGVAGRNVGSVVAIPPPAPASGLPVGAGVPVGPGELVPVPPADAVAEGDAWEPLAPGLGDKPAASAAPVGRIVAR